MRRGTTRVGLGEWLRLTRRKKNMTQMVMASRLGIAVQTVRNWESERTEPVLSLTQMEILLKILGIKFEEIPTHQSALVRPTENGVDK